MMKYNVSNHWIVNDDYKYNPLSVIYSDMDSSPESFDRAQGRPDPRDKKKFHFDDTPQRRALVAFARMLFSLVMEMEVDGLGYFPREGPVILAANHVTNFDVFPMQFALPRPIFFMGKAELFRNPIVDVLIRTLSGFPVHRGGNDQWAMRHAAKVLNHGQTLGMFPEGTRSKSRGLKVAKTGTARLAIEADCPIVPMTIVGSDLFFKRFPRRTRVHICILPPLMPNPGETPLALTDRLMFTLARALPEAMRGVYAETPEGFVT
ncbi:MAG: 1-acyl-sn-glycerol-3-phosphate acyltransferase [Anaerolineae bacterium]|nr:1-acyl-sn-glycerol-3-phosphate acyltransferase [Anaerolineae bacterium]